MRSDATCALLTCCSQLMSPPASCPFLVISSKISHTQSSLASSLLSFFHWFYPNQAPKQDHTLHLVVSFLKSFLILTDCLSPNPLLILAFWGRQCPLSHFLDSRDSSTSSGFFFFFSSFPAFLINWKFWRLDGFKWNVFWINISQMTPSTLLSLPPLGGDSWFLDRVVTFSLSRPALVTRDLASCPSESLHFAGAMGC